MKNGKKIPQSVFNDAKNLIKVLRGFHKEFGKNLAAWPDVLEFIKSEKKLNWNKYYRGIPSPIFEFLIMFMGFMYASLFEKSMDQTIEIVKNEFANKEKVDLKLSRKDLEYLKQNPYEILFALKAITCQLLCVVFHREILDDLIKNARKGKDRSLLKLVQIDKAFLTESWAIKRIKIAEFTRDQKFFIELAKVLQKGPLYTRKAHIEAGAVIIVFWDRYLRYFKYSEIYEFFEKLKLTGEEYGFTDENSLKVFIHRLRKIFSLKKRYIKKGV